MENQGGITVQRALELPGLRSGLPEVVAGADRLGRTVRWVHAGEVPNIASLLRGGLCRFVRHLDAAPCTASGP
ncbi:PucR family transcriptional regulator ligand-binding domain-containing protein, partial [Streptomyces sp. 900116325]